MAMTTPQQGAPPRPVHGLHRFAWRCPDAEATRRFDTDLPGVPNHDDAIHSLDVFDPNGLRLDPTPWVAPASQVEGFARTARADLARRTREKQSR